MLNNAETQTQAHVLLIYIGMCSCRNIALSMACFTYACIVTSQVFVKI